MRGKAESVCRNQTWSGITPAYAGKSLTIQKMTTRSRDHPRVCGEKIAGAVKNIGGAGSPPRMRGKVFDPCPIDRTSRITPAYAGKSFGGFAVRRFQQDHPRVCGEKSWQYSVMLSQIGITPAYAGKSTHSGQVVHPDWGSPPRMRGKGSSKPECEQHAGITPAYAGKRQRSLSRLQECTDHPRVCGEKLMMMTMYRE